MSKKQQILTTASTSIDKSAGEQGPPNRIAPQSDWPSSFLSTTPQIKNESQTPNPAQPVSFDASRENLNRMTIQTTNPTMISHLDTNGTQSDVKPIKTEQISPNHETKIQVSKVHLGINLHRFISILNNLYLRNKANRFVIGLVKK